MDAQLHVLTGGAAGSEVPLRQDTLSLGRHPKSDLRFDSATDPAVSAVHAVVTREGDTWFIQDLGSTNGTWVHGERITSAVRLAAGDHVQLGTDGPVLEFRLVTPQDGVERSVRPAERAGVRGSDNPPTGERIRLAVARQTRSIRAIAAACLILLLAAISVLVLSGRRERADWDRERAQMRERLDSLLLAGESAANALEGQLSVLGAALQDSQELVRRTRDELARARRRGDPAQVQQLERELDAAATTLSRQSTAAQLDFDAIQRQNRRAIALVYVESPDGAVSTGTAFAVRPDATLITNRHVVVGSNPDRPPRRIAIQFSDSDQVWPARLLAVSRAADLAVVKVDNIVGDVPVVYGINQRPDTLTEGAPLALIGFRDGGEGGASSGSDIVIARPSLGTGILIRASGQRLDIEGYGSAGASGSPVFDAYGEVVGVLFGGSASTSSDIFAVPAPQASALLRSLR